MAPKKNFEADLAELKTAMANIQAQLAPALLQEARLTAVLQLEAKLTPLLHLVEEFRQEKARNEQRDNRQDLMERRMHDLDQQARMNNVILTGLQLQPRARPGATGASMDANRATDATVEDQVQMFLMSKGISLDLDTVEVCHPLPRRKTTDKPAILIRFVNRKHKTALMKQRKQLKDTKVYLNEHLCKYNAELAKHARILRSKRQIQSTWIMNARIFIKPLGPPDLTKPLEIRSMKDFENCGITHV